VALALQAAQLVYYRHSSARQKQNFKVFFNDSPDGAARNGYMIFLSNQLYLLSAVHSGVGTGGSGGSMNRDPRAPGAPSSGATEKF